MRPPAALRQQLALAEGMRSGEACQWSSADPDRGSIFKRVSAGLGCPAPAECVRCLLACKAHVLQCQQYQLAICAEAPGVIIQHAQLAGAE
jgi:hypothetical protein